MWKILAIQLIKALIEHLDDRDAMREFMDKKILDPIEDKINEEKNFGDSVKLLAIKKLIRDPFNIPDNDDEDE